MEEIRRLARYLISGGFNAITCSLVFHFATSVAGFDIWVSNALALGIGVCIGFYMSNSFVFREEERRVVSPAIAVKYILHLLVIYVFCTALIYKLVSLGATDIVAWSLALPVYATSSYLMQKFFVFR